MNAHEAQNESSGILEEQFWCVLRAFSQIMRTSYLPPCKQRPVLRSVCCEHELHKLTMFVTQIPAERKLVLPNITFVSSEFGLLNYAGYWKICMEM
jgi:hypothetical protein